MLNSQVTNKKVGSLLKLLLNLIYLPNILNQEINLKNLWNKI